MRVRLICGLMLLGSLSSCEWFATEESRTQALVEEEIAGIDWNQVDQLPLFESCDETASRFKQQDCFESTLLAHVSEVLNGLDLQSEESMRDTLNVDFKVDNRGRIEVLSVEDHPLLKDKNPEFRRRITLSLKTLPVLQPALKRGVPVATRFRIPLILQSDE